MTDMHGLRIFIAVAEKLSFSRAAESLLLTQSAVSHHIAKMEREFGVPLLIRHARQVSLTPAGHTLLDHAKQLVRSFADLGAVLKTTTTPDQGRLRIGASATACQYLLPDALREFRECFPRYTLSITPGDSTVICQSIIDGHIDLGIMILPDVRPKLQCYDLFNDELGLVMNPLHPLAKVPKIRPADLAGQQLVLYTRTSATWRMIERQWQRMRIPIVDPIELGSIEAIKELVKLGLGISALASWVIGPQLADQSLVWRTLPGAKLRRKWVIATPPQHVLSVAEKTFVELLCQCSPIDAASNVASV
jgi:LysR family transcriptional regulator, low CO2-responsive transcriptional regulator